MPKLIERFKKDFPHIDIKLFSDGSRQIIKDIAAGKSQIGFVSIMDTDQSQISNFHREALFCTKVTAIATQEIYAKLGSKTATLNQLANFPLLTFTSEFSSYSELNEKMQTMCNKGSITFLENYDTLIQLCLAGMGIGFLPDVVAKMNTHVVEKRLKILDIKDLDVKRQIYLICQKNLPFSNSITRFIHLTHTLAKEY